jgi:uncharacterized membrane protein
LDRLEDRLAPTIDLVLGRVASADTTTNLTGSTIDVTYTIYNQRDVPLTAASIETTLASGVSITQSSLTSSATTGLVSWSVGNIPAFGRASVTATLSLPSMTTTTIDSGSRAMAAIDAGISTDTAPAIVLSNRLIPIEYLAATPDADRRDVVVQEQAARLDYDPTKIIDYLRNDVGYHAYSGSLRGARGTIWTNAANALDEASLGVALMRASGIPARYAQGTLSDSTAKQLILTMFPEPFQIVGYLAPGTSVADPANDPQLLTESKDYFWLQIDLGSGFQNADTSGLISGGLGNSITNLNGTFHEVADSLRHKVRISLDAETFSQATNAFQQTSGLATVTVLDKTWNAVDLVGRQVAVSQFVDDIPQGGLAFTSRALTYTPYFRIGDETDAINVHDEIFTGTPFQELLTNFPLASTILSGLNLKIEVQSPSDPVVHLNSMLVDRIGFAARQNGTATNISADANGKPALSNFDIVSVFAVSSLSRPQDSSEREKYARQLQVELSQIPNNQALTPTQLANARTLVFNLCRLLGDRYLRATDINPSVMDEMSMVNAYWDHARVILSRLQQIPGTATTPSSVQLKMDLLHEFIRVEAAPGQTVAQEFGFRLHYGLIAGQVERAAVECFVPANSSAQVLSVSTIFENAAVRNIPTILLVPQDRLNLANIITASPDVLARMEIALAAGKFIFVPARMVPVNGQDRLGWYEVDPLTGATIDVLDTGEHASAQEYSELIFAFIGSDNPGAFLTGFTFGLIVGIVIAKQNNLVQAQIGAATTAAGIFANFNSAASNLMKELTSQPLYPAFSLGFSIGAAIGPLLAATLDPPAQGQHFANLIRRPAEREFLQVALPATPGQTLVIQPGLTSVTTDHNTPAVIPFSVLTDLAGDYIFTAIAPDGWAVTMTANALQVTPAAGMQSGMGRIRLVARSVIDPTRVTRAEIDVNVTPTLPGLTLSVTHEPLLSVSFQAAELPTAYNAIIRNLGPETDEYTLQFSNVTPGWEVIASRPGVSIPGGTTGLIGIYLRPTGTTLPPPGTPISATITATSTRHAGMQQTVTLNVNMSTIAATYFIPNRLDLIAIPDSTLTSQITFINRGNASETVTLTATSLPSGYSLTGLPITVTLNPGEIREFNYSIAVSSTVPLNSLAHTTLSIDRFRSGVADVEKLTLSIRVAIPGATQIDQSSNTALDLGQQELSQRLDEFLNSMTTLVSTPSNSVARSQSLAALDAVIRLFNADPETASFGSQLGPVRDAIAAASTANELLAAMANLEPIFIDYVAYMQDRVEHGYTVSLAANVVVIQPGSPARIPIVLENTGTQTTTYDLTFASSLPYGVNGSFTSNTVTLAPGERLDGGPTGLFVEFTSTLSSVFPGPFTIRVAPQEAPSLQQNVTGAVEVRPEVIQLPSVVLSSPFAIPGNSVGVTARILNAVNIERPIRVNYRVSDSGGSVIVTSSTVTTILSLSTSLIDVPLTPFVIPAGLTGDLTIDVRVTESDGRPLANRTATLIVGLPVSASIMSDPQLDFVGTTTINSTLTLTGREPFANPAMLLGQVQTPPTATSVLVRGSIAYIAGTNGVSIVDVSNAAAPVVVGSFASNLIQSGNFTLIREMSGDRIVIASRGFLNADTFTLFTFSVANPTSPALLGQSVITEQFLTDMVIVGDRAFITTNGITFFGSTLIGQFGDVVSLDLTNPSAVTVIDELFGNAADNFNQNGIALADTTTAYVASTTSTGSASQTGQGIVRVIDLSNPGNLDPVREIAVPRTVQIQQVAVEGNRLMVLGSTGGWKSPFLGVADAQLTGRMTLSIFDITDRRNPILIGDTIVTDSFNRPVETADGGAMLSLTPLGGGRFVASRGFIDGQPVVMLIDTAGDRIAVAAIPAPSLVNETTFINGHLYATSGAGLTIYDIGTISTTTATARITVPNDANSQLIAASFNVPPTRIESSAGTETIVWERVFAFGNASSTLTWQTRITDLLTGQSRPVTNGTGVEFNHAGTTGSFELPGTAVAGLNAISLQPAEFATTPGTAVDVSVTIVNPTDQFANFNLFTLGLPPGWATFDGFSQGFASLMPNSTQTVTLRIQPPEGTSPQALQYLVGSSSNATISGRVQGRINVLPIPLNVDGDSHGIELSVSSGTPIIGRTTSNRTTVRMTNTGSATGTWTLGANLPTGVSAAFESATVTIPPGQSRDVVVTLTGSASIAAGQVPWTVSATSSMASDTATGSLRLVEVGAAVVPSSTSIMPGDPLSVTITNTGSARETFAIFAAGPAGVLATLAAASVALDPGQSQTIAITTQPISNSVPGDRDLIVVARSTSEPQVHASSRIAFHVASTDGFQTSLNRSIATIAAPGSADFVLTVRNLGNTESAYTLSTTDGPGTATFRVLSPTNRFRIPAFGQAQVTIRGTSTTNDTSSVTVNVQSNSGTTDSLPMTLETGGVSPPPPPPPVVVNPRPIAVGAGPGGAPIVRVIDADSGVMIREIIAYSPDFTGGVTVAMGDVTGDGVPDLITGAGPGGGPHIRIFDGVSGQNVMSFFAYDPAFRGGANVASGLMHAGKAWSIVTGAGPGGGPHVRTWTLANGQISMVGNMMAYDQSFRGGVSVATADLNQDGLVEIITGPGPGGGPHLAAFAESGQQLGSVMAFDPTFRGGLSVAGRNSGSAWTLYAAPLTVGDGIVHALTTWNSSPSLLTSASGEMISTRIAIAENQLLMARHHDLSVRRIDLNSSSELNSFLPFSDSNMLGIYIG